jgi:chromosome segregation ATPase
MTSTSTNDIDLRVLFSKAMGFVQQVSDRKDAHNEALQEEILQQKALVDEKFHIVTSLTLRIDTLEAQINRNDIQIAIEKEKIKEMRDEMNDTQDQELHLEIVAKWRKVRDFERAQDTLRKQVNELRDELEQHKIVGKMVTMRYKELLSREKTFQQVMLETLLDRLG